FEGSALTGNGLTIRASAPLTLAVAPKAGGADREVKTAKPSEITLAAAKPASVMLNGAASKAWKFDAKTGMLTVSVPEERTNGTVR
ncbi:MAG: hypothetical protein ACYC9O_13565, partial [Candidatus Latescibacterota bacterium]